jgi:diamine N-acetyltransferase
VSTTLTVVQLQENPAIIAVPLKLKSGADVLLRLLQPGDAAMLGRYFEGLSADTRRRYGPHPFDQATANALCATLNYADTLRLVAISQDEIIAYTILQLGILQDEQSRYGRCNITLDGQQDCTVAPSVADAFQDQGLGKLVMEQTIEIARRLGRRWMVLMGGTQATNDRAVHFYQRFGFHLITAFDEPPGYENYDMRTEL